MCTACLHMPYILVQECKEGIYEVYKSFSNYYCASFEHDMPCSKNQHVRPCW